MALKSSVSITANASSSQPAGMSDEAYQKRLARLRELLSQAQASASQRNGLHRGVSLYVDCMRVLDLDPPESTHPLLPIPDGKAAYPVRATEEEKKQNPLLHIPPSLFGYISIPAAYALVHLPDAVNRLKMGGMNDQDKAFVDRLLIVDLAKSKYSAKDYAAKVKHAEELLHRFKQPDGDQWFKSLPAVKYFLTKHFNPATNQDVAVARLKQQVIVEAMCLKYGIETHRLQDMDGTQVFKNFATATCNAEPNISPKDRLAHYLTIAFKVKAREALNYSNQRQNDPRFNTNAMVKELLSLGFFKPTQGGMTKPQLETYLNVWAANTDAAFPHLTQEQLKYMLLSSIDSANTARAGGTVNEISETIPTNDVLGLGVKPHKFNLQSQNDFYAMLGLDRRPDLALNYMFDVNGYSGKVIANKQIYHPQQMIELGYSNIYKLLEDVGLVEELTKQDILPRVVEFKGNYKHYDKELVTDHLNWRAERLDKQSLAWIKKQDGFNPAKWAAKDPHERAKWVNQLDLNQKHPNGEKIGKPAMALPHAWVLEMDRLSIDAVNMLNELNADKKLPHYQDFNQVLNVIARRTRALDAEDHHFLSLPHLQELKGSRGQTMIHAERAKRLEAYTQKSLAKTSEDITPEGVVPMGQYNLRSNSCKRMGRVWI